MILENFEKKKINFLFFKKREILDQNLCLEQMIRIKFYWTEKNMFRVLVFVYSNHLFNIRYRVSSI